MTIKKWAPQDFNIRKVLFCCFCFVAVLFFNALPWVNVCSINKASSHL